MPFNAKKFIEQAVANVKKQVGNGKAVIGVSGGIDSTVTAALMSRALGDKCISVCVDGGYARKGEPEKVVKMGASLGMNIRLVDAKDGFYKALKGVIEPEQKRKRIGETFIRVFEKVAKEEKAEFLGQGTIAPDWIESGSGLRDTIKSHHNVGGLPKEMKLKLVEPLRELYKDEVRQVARELGLPPEISERQPFPGPGLAVRIMGEATKENAEIIREACAIAEEEIEKAAKAGRVALPWQYFAVLLPIKSVGVHGDMRAYGYTIVIRAVESLDGMTAKASPLPPDVLEAISNRITRELKSKVTRVVYDVTSKPPATIEWE